MTVFRLVNSAYADLSGQGAKKYGRRSNPPGVAAVYCSEHISLCVLEVLVGLDTEDLPSNYVTLTIEIPDPVQIQRGTYQEAYASNGRNPVWVVPSVLVPREHNIVLYPDASAFDASISDIEPFVFDPGSVEEPTDERMVDNGRT